MRAAGYRFFRVIGYRTNLSSARNALAYAAFRSDAVKGRTALIFDDRTDTADVRAFQRKLEDRVTANPRSAKAFHALFSLPRNAFEQVGADWREILRAVIRDYELQTRRKLTWIAVQHDDPRHPHAHVIIKATYQDPAGKTRKLYLRRPELDRIKDTIGRALEARGLRPDLAEPTRVPMRSTPERWGRAVGLGLGLIGEFLAQERRRREQEREEALRRWKRDHHDRGR